MRKFRTKTAPGSEHLGVEVHAAQYTGNEKDCAEIGSLIEGATCSVVGGKLVVFAGSVAIYTLALGDWLVRQVKGGDAYVKDAEAFSYNYVEIG
jgi:hypothetical protein